MKKIIYTLSFILIGILTAQGQTQLVYDNDTFTDWQGNVEDQAFAVRMSPSGPCEVVSMEFYVDKQGVCQAGIFGELYEWEDTSPGAESVYQETAYVLLDGWFDIPVEELITFDGDFVVAYNPIDDCAYLAYDADLDTERNWVLEGTTWSLFTSHTFLIRATVLYTTGQIEILEGTPISVYPNPASDVLYIDASSDIQKVTFYTSSGKLVKSMDVQTGKTQLSLKGLESGVYFINIENGSDLITKKLIIN